MHESLVWFEIGAVCTLNESSASETPGSQLDNASNYAANFPQSDGLLEPLQTEVRSLLINRLRYR